MKRIFITIISMITAFLAVSLSTNQRMYTYADGEESKEVKTDTAQTQTKDAKSKVQTIDPDKIKNKGKLSQKQIIKRKGPGPVA